jgi:hypothetical protein
MNDVEPVRPGDGLQWPKGAQRLGTVLLGALAVIVVLAVRDRARVADLEHFEESTAVGDTAYFRRSRAAQMPPPVVARLNGQPLYIIDNEKRELKDTAMLRVGRDDAAGLSVYTSRKPPAGDPNPNGKPRYYLKLGRNDYIRVGAVPPESIPP